MIRFRCPTCNKRLKSPIAWVDQKISCPRCGQRVKVPDLLKPAAGNKTKLGHLDPSPPPPPPPIPAPTRPSASTDGRTTGPQVWPIYTLGCTLFLALLTVLGLCAVLGVMVLVKREATTAESRAPEPRTWPVERERENTDTTRVSIKPLPPEPPVVKPPDVVPNNSLPSNSPESKPPVTLEPFKEIDNHALKAPKEVEQSIGALAKYLTGPAKTDQEKTRAIYRWMTDRISYNAEVFLAGKPVGDCSAEVVLKSRKSVCEGYANLFQQLAELAGIEVLKISGNAKGYGYVPREKMSKNHAWNAVKIEGSWYGVDVTWGAGGVEKEKGFIKQFDDYWFLTPPEQFIFNHFPDDPARQFLSTPIKANTYQGWPVEPSRWFMLGFQVEDILGTLSKPDFRGLVEGYAIKGGQNIKVIKAPLEKHLQTATPYEFHIEAKTCSGLAIINNGKWQNETPDNGVYHFTVTPNGGQVQVAVKIPGGGANYRTILKYLVE